MTSATQGRRVSSESECGNRKGIHSNKIRHLQPKQVPQECLMDFRLRIPGGDWRIPSALRLRTAPEVVEELRCRIHPAHQKSIPRSGASDVQQVPLRLVDLLQVGIVGD